MPLLSIPIVARDDDYLPGYMDRVRTCIDSLLEVFKDDVEVIALDFNQNPGRPLSNVLKQPQLKHIVVTADMYKNKLKEAYDVGVRVVDGGGRIFNIEEVFANFPFASCWAINEGLHHSTGKYFVYTSSDVIATKVGAGRLLSSLRPNVLFKPLCSTLEHSQLMSHRDELINTGTFNGNYPECKKYNMESMVGNGLFFVIDVNSAKRIGGYLPYLVHRGKGCDLFAAYIADGLGIQSFVPDFSPLEVQHKKSKPTFGIKNFHIIENNGKIFDFIEQYEIIRQWRFSHYLRPGHVAAKNQCYRLKANPFHAKDILQRFSNIYSLFPFMK